MNEDKEHRADRPADEFENDGPRDRLEGRYTEVDGEEVPERTVHGQYTRVEGDPGPDPEVEGGYTDRNGKNPSHLTEERQGKYTRTEE